MYEILVQAVLDGADDIHSYIYLGGGLELPVAGKEIAEMMSSLNITEENRPFTAYGYLFRLDSLNGKIMGERRLDELNRFARYLSSLHENERAQLARFAGRHTHLTPTECMTDTPLLIGEDTREFTVAIMPEEYHSVPSVGYLHLPATDEEFIDAFDRARTVDIGYYIGVRECRRPFLNDILPSKPELFELNHLAERLAELDEIESLFFEAMVKMEKEPPNVARLINLTYNLDDCVLAPAQGLEELGRFAVQNGFYTEFDNLKDEMLETLNYQKLGELYKKEYGGVFVDGCLVMTLSPESEMESTYDGNPPVPELKPRHVFRLFLASSIEDGKGVYLDLPASVYDMNLAAKRLGRPNLTGCDFIICRSSIPKLNESLTGSESIYELSDLAEYLQMLRDDGDLPKYKAALEITNCADFSDYFSLAENLHNYEYYPEMISEYDYGEWELLGEYKLDSACAGMEHFNFAAFGRERMKQNGVVSTPYGMIRRIGPEQELTPQDDVQRNNPDAGMKFK